MAVGRAARRTTFAAPLDRAVLAVTTLCVVVVGVVLMILVFAHSGDSGWMAVFGAACVAIVFGGYAFSPVGYRVRQDNLMVKRRLGHVDVSLHALQDVRIDERLREPLGFLGFRNGGLFGIYGRVYRRGRGWTWFWGRRIGPIVTLEFPRHRVMVMPSDPEGFAAAIRDAAWRNDW
jgi:hypothetical protein